MPVTTTIGRDIGVAFLGWWPCLVMDCYLNEVFRQLRVNPLASLGLGCAPTGTRILRRYPYCKLGYGTTLNELLSWNGAEDCRVLYMTIKAT